MSKPTITIIVGGKDDSDKISSKRRRLYESESSDDSDSENYCDSCLDSDSDSDSSLGQTEKPVIILNGEQVDNPTESPESPESPEPKDTDSECNSNCGCEEDCECDTVKNCPKYFPRRPHKSEECKCAKCANWDTNDVPTKPHKEWNCDCNKCEEWIQAYFERLHPQECKCKYCAFVTMKTRFFDYE